MWSPRGPPTLWPGAQDGFDKDMTPGPCRLSSTCCWLGVLNKSDGPVSKWWERFPQTRQQRSVPALWLLEILTIGRGSAASLILKPLSEGFPQPGTRNLKFPDVKQLALGHTVGQRQSQNLNSRLAFMEAFQPKPTLTFQELCVGNPAHLLSSVLWSTLTGSESGGRGGWPPEQALGLTWNDLRPLLTQASRAVPPKVLLSCSLVRSPVSSSPPSAEMLTEPRGSSARLPSPPPPLLFTQLHLLPGKQCTVLPPEQALLGVNRRSFFLASKEPFPFSWYHFLRLMFRAAALAKDAACKAHGIYSS